METLDRTTAMTATGLSSVHDSAFYYNRARRYALMARLESEPVLRSALEQIVRICHEKLERLSGDVTWKDA